MFCVHCVYGFVPKIIIALNVCMSKLGECESEFSPHAFNIFMVAFFSIIVHCEKFRIARVLILSEENQLDARENCLSLNNVN